MTKRTTALGFSSALTVGDLVIKGLPLGQLVPPYSGPDTVARPGSALPWKVIDNLSGAVIDIIVQRSMVGASNVTVQMADPDRTILNSGLTTYGDVLSMDGLNFALVQQQKQGDQLQWVFESATVYNLRKQTGTIATTQSRNLTSFVESLVAKVPGTRLVAEQAPTYKAISLSRGGVSYPDEDSWSCMNRLATSAGWRCFESEGIIYLGSDAWLLNEAIPTPPGSPTVLEEFTSMVEDMDFDWDIGKPYGQVVVTALTDLWPYQPGNRVSIARMGPASTVKWLVYSMERDFFNAQASIVLQAPTSAAQIAAGTPTLSNI